MKRCELCTSPARMYCDSDGASLCWDCDARVHSANFLVANHSRCLLCHLCQSLTPWFASGTDLGRTVSICVTCAAKNSHNKQQQLEAATQSQRPEMASRNIADRDPSHEDTEEEEEDEVSNSEGEYSIDDDEEGENQVVPWSCSPSPGTSFSNSEDLSSCTLYPGGVSSVLKYYDNYSKEIDVAGSEKNDTDTDTDCCCSSILHREDAATPEATSSPAVAASDPLEASISLSRSYYWPGKVKRQESVVTRTEAGEEEIMVRTRKRFKQSNGAGDDKVSNGGGYVWDMQER